MCCAVSESDYFCVLSVSKNQKVYLESKRALFQIQILPDHTRKEYQVKVYSLQKNVSMIYESQTLVKLQHASVIIAITATSKV